MTYIEVTGKAEEQYDFLEGEDMYGWETRAEPMTTPWKGQTSIKPWVLLLKRSSLWQYSSTQHIGFLLNVLRKQRPNMALKPSHSTFSSETRSALQDLLGKCHTAIRCSHWPEYLEGFAQVRKINAYVYNSSNKCPLPHKLTFYTPTEKGYSIIQTSRHYI